jgi:undecaprenyl-diphosphatase
MTTTTPAERRLPTRGWIGALVVALVVVIAIIGFGLTVVKSASFTATETGWLAQIAATRQPTLVDVSLAIDRIFSPPFAALIGLVAAVIVFLITRRWRAVIHFALLVLVTWLGSEVVKVIVHRPRPTAHLADTLVPNPDPDSYPSGHVCFAVGLGFAIFVLVARRSIKAIVGVLAVLLSLVTAVSRVYLGVHYPTDALVSLLYAAVAFIAVEALWRRFGTRVLAPRRKAHSA